MGEEVVVENNMMDAPTITAEMPETEAQVATLDPGELADTEVQAVIQAVEPILKKM